jgi:hypothetical protein
MKQEVETGARAADSIDLRDDQEIAYWCGKLRCSEEELRRAIADVGQSPLLVAEHLGLTESAIA